MDSMASKVLTSIPFPFVRKNLKKYTKKLSELGSAQLTHLQESKICFRKVQCDRHLKVSVNRNQNSRD